MEEFISEEKLIQIFSSENQSDFEANLDEIERSHPLMLDDKFGGEIIVNKKVSGDELKSENVQCVKFFNCRFDNCDLTGSFYWMSTFEKCTFNKCVLDRVVFRKCELYECEFIKCECRFYLNISESYLYHSAFQNCHFEGIEISGTQTVDTQFEDSSIAMGRFQVNFTYRVFLSRFSDKYLDDEDRELIKSNEVFDDLVFENCLIHYMNFLWINFMDVKFWNSEIFRCSFSGCNLYNYNFEESNDEKSWGTNSIDMSSLKESQNLSSKVLKKMFNIEPKYQLEIKKMLKEKIMSSVFISYSLKDSEIAKNINEFLKSKDVTTFLWENDAPGGKTLKDIMKSNIDSKDRLLFIASENSLKSKACHFELTQGREKQDKLWKTILFPIHLDDFLFRVEYDEIRPKVKRDEFWENIQELRDINSLDFSKFNNGIGRKKKEFNELMERLVDSLKME